MLREENTGQFKEVLPRVNVDEMERGILAFWETEKIFEKSLEATKDGEQFTFYDGPPYATGKPHYGHILQSSIKDTVLRYKTMQGYYVPRRVGWDCHGLPVENLVEKEYGIKNKKEIEDDIEGFNTKCREMVSRYIDGFTATLKRLGRWAEYDNAYATLDRNYMESEWWAFKQLWEKYLVYKGFRSTPYCVRCGTPLSNFEVSMEYKDVVDLAVYVTLPVTGHANLSLLIWTTTPWTLPGNVAVAVGKDMSYVTVERDGKQFVIAKDRVEAVFGADATSVKDWTLDELLSLRYEPLYESTLTAEEKAKSFGVVVGDHVTAEDGTGLVHMAPAFGEEDFLVGKKEGLPILRTVGLSGLYLPDVPLWAGKHIFKANKEIAEDLKARGLLFKEEQYTHSYPHCWRCATPLIYYALDSWFIRVTQIKDQLLKHNEQIHWVPEHVKAGRFAKGIESAPDWAVSRNRFWSVPLPVWECNECDHTTCVGGIEELQKLSGASDEQVQDIHRPYVDDITWKCEQCDTGTMKRVTEVLDVWFDSGSMPYSQWHYPFENKEKAEKSFPADFIVEAIEMTRAWFYVIHVLATALKDSPAFKNVIASGIIFAADGKKLSKKLKNYPDIEPTMEKYGADVLRFYLLSSSTLGEPYYFSGKEIQQVQRNVHMMLWNVYSFFVRYANVHEWKPGKKYTGSEHILDKWVLTRLAQLEREVMKATDEYRVDTASRLFVPFIDDLSNWYVRRSRPRFQKPGSDTETEEAFGTLYEVLVRVSKLLAPFMPFVAEEMYRNLTGGQSVHLEKLTVSDKLVDQELLIQMKSLRETVAQGLALRAESKIKVRQPLSRMYVPNPGFPLPLAGIVAEEVNVKNVDFVLPMKAEEKAESIFSEDGKVGLNTVVTPELKAEGMARDIIRQGQVLRREMNYALDDRIMLVFSSDDAELTEAVANQKEMITKALQADEIVPEGAEDKGEDLKFDGKEVHIGVRKI
ncbi:MAG: isoleucine--tRNA ligase [Candidatus Andersenbacteria bacterium]|nr:isoleucine--tRNA ligase [Candidatus Andersenbacteria bacterium]